MQAWHWVLIDAHANRIWGGGDIACTYCTSQRFTKEVKSSLHKSDLWAIRDRERAPSERRSKRAPQTRESERASERVKETEYRPCRDISTPGGKIQFVSFFDALLLGCSFMCLLVVVNVSRQENLLCFDEKMKRKERGRKKRRKKKEFLLFVFCLGP